MLNLAPAEYAKNAFSSKEKYEKLAVVVEPVIKNLGNWSFHVVDLQRTAMKCTKNYKARAPPLFCSLNFLFGDVPVVFCVRSLFKQLSVSVEELSV